MINFEWYITFTELEFSAQEKLREHIDDRLSDAVLAEIKEKTDEEWAEADEEYKKKWGYKDMLQMNRMDKVAELAEKFRTYVQVEIKE